MVAERVRTLPTEPMEGEIVKSNPLLSFINIGQRDRIYGLISSGIILSICAANTIHNFRFFIPPGTYQCRVGRGSMECEVSPTLLHMTSNGNKTPDLLILKSNALSTLAHASIYYKLYYLLSCFPNGDRYWNGRCHSICQLFTSVNAF